jgi:diguanylate cyclase (GGDEF)-like protein/PAS domain S-box-containing protein
MSVLVAVLASLVAGQYAVIGLAVIPRLARLARGRSILMRAAQFGATAFFLGCGLTHAGIALQALGGGLSEHAQVEHVLPHLAQVIGGLIFIVVVQSRLDIRVAHKDAAARETLLEAQFRAAFEEAPLGVALISLGPACAGRFLQANAALAAMVGHPADWLLQRAYPDVVHPDDRQQGAQVLRSMTTGVGDRFELEQRMVHHDGHVLWAHVLASVIRDEDGEPRSAVLQVRDVTEERHHQAQLRFMADHDPLTGVLSRRRFETELDAAVARVRRDGGPAALVVVDVDQFKYINDTYGHACGDDLLCRVGEVLSARVRATDVIGRLGGDVFGVLCAHTDADGAAELAGGLLEAVRQDAHITVEDRVVRVTASIGVKCIDGADNVNSAQFGVEADSAMYEAKEGGRDRITTVTAGMTGPSVMRSRLAWSERIRHALHNGGLQAWEQPILNLRTGECDRSELLVRMTDQQDGSPIAPAEFLDTAERFGQIQAIDAWVFTSAIGVLATRQAAGSHAAIEVNLSGASVTDQPLMDLLVDQILTSSIDPSKLIFEITETAAIINFDTARQFADRLGRLGCQFALDDFGSGFGSFYYLKHLPFDCVKIDGEFVKNLPTSTSDQLTVQAIVQISQGMGKDTTAEFVQDDATLQVLRDYGVDYGQGYHIGRPHPVLELV